MQLFQKYYATIAFLEGLANIPQQKDYMRDRNQPELYLKRMRYFFELIPDIRRTVLRTSGGRFSGFKFIHVAGTSGKGSVTTMLHEVLRAACLRRQAGERVGSFTSPFTTTSIEKIRVGEKYISPQELVEIVDELKPYITRAYMESPFGGPSYFEIWFAIAILYFLRKKCDWVVLEVGLGGKYDPGVLLSGCVATVLTNVDYDHTQLLGRTLTKIAREKVGIMRRGVPFFTAEQRPQLLRMFEKMTQKKRIQVVQDISVPSSHPLLISPSKRGRNQFVSPPRTLLRGGVSLPATARHEQAGGGGQPQIGMDYQGHNAALVTAVAEYLKVPEQAIVKGIERARLPCRFEIVQTKPTVVIDGAHSVAKMQATLINLEHIKFNKLHLVLAIAANKDVDGICKVIVPWADRVYVTRFDMILRESTHLRDLIRAVKKHAARGARVEVYMDCRDALDSALAAAGTEDFVLATGSFFMVGKLREKWYSEDSILKTRNSF